ncbi:MAG: capsular biosynthesis protein [Gammaproteobacteria bacterium]|nr:capsular biosynthesis protein [Gammaproteobacteria bacterium]
MIDLHCHLLPGIDDGAKNMEIAISMAELASANGIKKAVLTPHIIPGRYDNTQDSIRESFNNYNSEIKHRGIELELAMAAEVRLDPVIINMLETDTLPFLGEIDKLKLMLLEFPHSTIPPIALETVEWLLKRNVCPVIAHPERNKAVIDNYKKIKPFVDAGAMLQVTAASLTGTFGGSAKSIGKKLLKKGWVSLIASDAHNLSSRPPEMEPGRIVAEKIVGENVSYSMVWELPEKITNKLFSKQT